MGNEATMMPFLLKVIFDLQTATDVLFQNDTRVLRFEEIFYATKDRVYTFIKGLVRDDSKVQDCMQQCYMKLWETLDAIDTKKEVLPLLYTYARNLVIDHIRKQSRHVSIVDMTVFAEQLTDDGGTEAWLEQKETNNELEQLLKQMPPRRRQVFTLVKLNGFSYREVARHLNITVSTVEKHMHEAYRSLSREPLLKLFIAWLITKDSF